MNRKDKKIALYSQIGHSDYPEDTWEYEKEIDSEDELFEFMKEIHLKDASNRNNYPILSHVEVRSIKFVIKIGKICDCGHFHIDDVIECNKPDYFENSISKYKEWIDSLKIQKELNKKQLKEDSERRQYERLKEKFANGSVSE